MRQRFHKGSANTGFGSVWKLTKLTPGLMLLAGCGPSADSVREANAVAGAIPAGIYSNVYYSAEGGDLVGTEVFLPQGSNSLTAEITECGGECLRVQTVEVRRGLNGVFFQYSAYGRPVTVAAERDGRGMTVNVDRQGESETYRLLKVEREWGLRVARGH